MKLSYKIVIINILLAFVVSVFIMLTNQSDFSDASGFAILFGLICLISGPINLITGLILAFIKKSEWRDGFLLSSAALLLLSGISCGSGFAFGNL